MYFLPNRLQYVQVDEDYKSKYFVKCAVPQGSVQVPLLFLQYVNDRKNISPVFDPIKFSGGTNFFLAHSEEQKLFWTIYQEIPNISLCFASNILSLNSKKSPKYSFFHKPSKTTKFCSMKTWTGKSTSKIAKNCKKSRATLPGKTFFR